MVVMNHMNRLRMYHFGRIYIPKDNNGVQKKQEIQKPSHTHDNKTKRKEKYMSNGWL